MNGRPPFPGLTVRPVGNPGDDQRIRRLFGRLSPETVYRRFFTIFPSPTPAVMRYLTVVDHGDHERLAVLDGNEIVALASWDRPAHDVAEAELAILVEDAWQHRGLGRALMGMLTAEAARRGITELNATVLSDNQPARSLALSLARPEHVRMDGPETSYTFRVAS
ncbi:MAG: GCN5-related N-acetyltransferase [Acidimicrobiales bacterium]|nr:GCN5-related N-acetyltransferase [Acidimicrobiales bacterium]